MIWGECSIISGQLVEKTISSPFNCFGGVSENQLTMNVWIYFWALGSLHWSGVCPEARAECQHPLSWWLQLHHMWGADRCESSRFEILSVILSHLDFVWVLWSACSFRQKGSLGFWQVLHEFAGQCWQWCHPDNAWPDPRLSDTFHLLRCLIYFNGFVVLFYF